MAPLHRFDGMVIALDLEGDVEGVDEEADGAPHHIGNEQPLGLVCDVCFGVARDGLVEVTCLEEEEAHEEERPAHHLEPPPIVLMAAEGDGVQANHADDADAAQEIKCMVAFLHGCKGSDF